MITSQQTKNKSKRPANWNSNKTKNKSNNKNNISNNNNNFEKICFYCKNRYGKEDCFELKKKLKRNLKKDGAYSSADQAEVVLMAMCEKIFN